MGATNGLHATDAGAGDSPRGGEPAADLVGDRHRSGPADMVGGGAAHPVLGAGIEFSPTRKALMTARLKAQVDLMKGAKRNRQNPFAKNTYATLEAVLEAAAEPLCANGLVLTQWASDIEISGLRGERRVMRVYTRIEHAETSEYVQSCVPMVLARDDAHGIGSAMTYGRRYALKSLLGIPEVDDDGAAAVGQESELRKPARKSSAESKRDGTDKLFNEIKDAIVQALSGEHLRHVGETYRDVIAEMPEKWADLLRDEYETKAEQLRRGTS